MATPKSISAVDCIDRIACLAREGQLTVFCGAGISKLAGLPDAIQFVRNIVDWTSMTSQERDLIARVVPKTLPFERLMETVLGLMTDPIRDRLLSVFGLGQPAIAHRFIARMAKRWRLSRILTTNFDCHIETALRDEGLERDRDFIARPALRNTTDSLREMPPLELVKLHGSVDSPEDMAITVKAVARKEGISAINDAIKRAFAGDTSRGIVVFGYSFSDSFDIYTAIEMACRESSVVSVLVVDHATGANTEADVTFLPFEGLRLPHPLRNHPSALRMCADTGWVIRELSSRLEIEVTEDFTSSDGWRVFLGEFAHQLDRGTDGLSPDALAGALLVMIGAHEASIPYLRRTVERAALTNKEQIELASAQSLIEALSGADRLEEARDLALHTEPQARSVEGGVLADTVLSHLGSIHKQIAEKNLASSRVYFEEAANISAKDGVTVRCVPHVAGIAAAWMRLGDMDAALTWYMQAYEIVKDSGDPSRHAEVCGNIASFYYINRDYPNALLWYERALQISELAGDERNVSIHLMNRANVFVKQKRFDAAITGYGEARTKLHDGDPLIGVLDVHEGAARRMMEESKHEADSSAG